jgi:dihydrolipoamide dehydrogenase
VEWIRGRGGICRARPDRGRPSGGPAAEIENARTIVASGSHPVSLPVLPVDGRTIITTDENHRPDGMPAADRHRRGRVIGCEYAFIFRTFGA